MSGVKRNDPPSLRSSSHSCRRKAEEISDKALRVALLDLAEAYDDLIARDSGDIRVSLAPATIH